MRIISPFRDYYDGVQAYGHDDSLSYVRKSESVKWSTRKAKWPFPFYGYGSWGGLYVTHKTFVIGFCGKIYPLLRVFNRKTKIAMLCYTLDEAITYVLSSLNKRQTEAFRKGKKTWLLGASEKSLTAFFQEAEQKKNSFSSFFETSPIFIADRQQRPPRIIYNAQLTPYQFYRVFDAYAAFQEIAMFLGNQAEPAKEMPSIPDELKAQSKGFNKWSFRTPPGGR